MNKERLKKLIYDLDITSTDLKNSIDLIDKYSNNKDFKDEFGNSLKYKYLSLFIIYEDFISMLLKEYNLHEIGITVDKAIRKLAEKDIITNEHSEFLNNARLIRNKIGQRYKQPSVESMILFLEEYSVVMNDFSKFIRGKLN